MLEDISPGLSDDKLDVELHRAQARVETKLREDCAAVVGEAPSDLNDIEKIGARVSELFERVNDFGKAQLSEYIVHRKLILDLLKKRLEMGGDGKYSLEEAVHSIIFPLQSTSDDIDYERQNLWIIDEKLVYHRYLASDKPLSSLGEVADVGSKKEPDLIIFDTPYAFAEDGAAEFSAIVIIEFKRPARDDYSEGKNPLTQVYGYIDDIRDGRTKDRKGRPMNVPPNLPVYAFIVADITPTMRRCARDASLTVSADGKRYFGYNAPRLAYVEVMAYDKLVSDAYLRNRVLFDKLGLLK